MSSTSSTGSATQRVTGLASGFDTQSIVESLMAIERQPLDKLDIKKQTEELKLQAYQAVNTYLLKFRNSVSSLSSRKLWNSKTTTSTNEKSLTATANEYAVKGSYSFKVAQLATATQYMSKGFSSSKTALAPPKKTTGADGKEVTAPPEKLGEINLSSAKTRVDNSAKLESLNGAKGIFRGSIRVTDSSNGTANIDLSACDTLDDVVRTINEASGVRINASIRDGRLYIEDESNGTGTMKIQNVGAGTTATDLGIAGSSVDENGDPTKFIHGRNVYTLGEDMALSMLNDGLGVEEGTFGLRVYDESSYVEMVFDINDCKTVGDVMKRVNAEIERMRTEGYENPADNVGGGDPAKLLKNLRFGVSSDGTSFGFTGVTEGHSYQFLDINSEQAQGQTTPAEQLGLTNDIQSVAAGQREVSFGRVLGDANSPMLKNLGGVDENGVGKYPADERVSVAFNRDTKVSALNGGEGLNTSTGLQFILLEGGKDSKDVEISTKDNMQLLENVVDMQKLRKHLEDNPDLTVEELVDYLNAEIDAYASDPANNAAGLRGMTFKIDEYNNRLVIDGVQANYSVQIAGSLAGSLGLTRARSSDGKTGSALELDKELDAELRDAVDKFYGMGEYSESLRGSDTNKDIVMKANPDKEIEATKLGELTGLLDPNDIEGSIAKYFGPGQGITLTTGDARNPSTNEIGHDYDGDGTADATGMSVTVKWEDLLDENGDPFGEITKDTDFGAMIEAMNRAISKAFAETEQPSSGTGQYYEGHVPQLRLNSLATGLQWSNMDFTNYWDISDAGNGGGLEAMNLSRSVADTAILTEGRQEPSVIKFDLDPKAIGYVETVEITADTADTVTIGELNYGLGITLGGEETDTFEIEFQASTAAEGEEYNGKKISFTMKELREAVADWISGSENPDPTNKKALSDLTLNEYMGILNGLVDEKIDEYYTDVEPGVAAEDRFSMDFKVSDGTFIVDGLENATSLKISGNAVDYPYGVRSGIAPIMYSADDLKGLDDKEIVVNYVTGGTLHQQDIEGLGDIYFTLDGDDDYDSILKLNTKGLDQNSTLNDLINHLNDQLADMATTNKLLKDVKFTINDSGTGIALDNGSNARITFIDTFQLKDPNDKDSARISDAQTLARDLGLTNRDDSSNTVEAYSFFNAKSVGRNYLSRATSLEDFVGANAEMGGIRITNTGGYSVNLGLENCKTVGDVIDAINALNFGVYAQINARGDGIDIIEAYKTGEVPDISERQGNITISDVDGGSSIAKKLGIAGTANKEEEGFRGQSVLRGSLSTKIEVMSTDTLESLMYRISEAGYKTAIINDGSSTNPYRLTVSASNTGEANDFVIECDIAALGFSQTSRGRDSKVLYGDPNSSSSPVMLSSSTNTNSNAILGLTLDLKQATADWTTITIDDDKEKVTETIKEMITSYNELSEIIKMLDAYDSETGEEGILFGDTAVRSMMDDLTDFFYQVYNPNNKVIGSVDDEGKQQTWTWMDLGINLTASASNADGTGGWYNLIDFDEDALTEMVSSNWDVLSKMLANETNVANINADANVKPTGSFNGDLEEGFSVDGAINGDINKASFGTSNGIQAKGTIKEGNNSYTIWFQKATTISRMSVYHESADTALKNYTIEYLDASTGKWETLRELKDNTTDANHLGMSMPVNASAVRITAADTNAEDGKFRLLDVQIFEESGLAGKMNQHTTTLGDTQLGFLAERNTEIQANITDLKEQMSRLEEKLTLKEESLWRRFTAMETALSKLQSQGDYFSNMMSSMNNSNSK